MVFQEIMEQEIDVAADCVLRFLSAHSYEMPSASHSLFQVWLSNILPPPCLPEISPSADARALYFAPGHVSPHAVQMEIKQQSPASDSIPCLRFSEELPLHA